LYSQETRPRSWAGFFVSARWHEVSIVSAKETLFMRTLVSTALSLVLFAAASFAQEPPNACPCVPITHLWIAKTCPDWTCAATELAVANGDPQVIAVPVGMSDGRWLVVRRLAAGAAIDSGDPFRVEQFDGMPNAVQRYGAITTDHKPMLMTAPDGQVLVMALRQAEPRRRAAAH
jgi:hypothetical protein